MVLFRYLYLILFCSSLLFGGLLKPYNNQTISYIHILFEWEQQPDAIAYQIQLSGSDSFENNPNLLLDAQTSNVVYIYQDSIDWNNT